MKTVLNSRRRHYLARAGIFLIAAALIAGMVGCGGGGIEYDLTITSTAGGSVTTPDEGTFTYDQGEEVNLVATPDDCYQFVNWTGDTATIADPNAATTTITMNGDYSITANFEEAAVTFADSNLEAAVREAIGKPTGPIYPSDLDELTTFTASEKNIIDLTGLECATSLTELNLNDNQIIDISPLTGLTSLTELLIYKNQISDISPLANLTDLTELNLAYNQISDISPLASLTDLTRLSLWDNQISDISPLANLTNLTWLQLADNQISDISPLVDNEGLSTGDEVYLAGNPLSSDSIQIYIPQLEARGVIVDY